VAAHGKWRFFLKKRMHYPWAATRAAPTFSTWC